MSKDVLRSTMARARNALPPPVRDALDDLEGRDVLFLAAGLAFYALVSVAPLVLLALWLTSIMVGEEDVHRTGEQLARLVPPKLGVDKAVVRVADTGSNLGLWAAALSLWPATAYGAGLARAFDRLSGKGRQLEGLRGRALSLSLVIVLQSFVLAGLALATVAPRLVGEGLLATVAGWAIGLVSGFLAIATATAVIYWLFSSESVAARPILVGASLTAGGTTVLSLAYVAFLRLGANFEQRYATSGLAAVVLLAVWLFLANALLLSSYRLATRWD